MLLIHPFINIRKGLCYIKRKCKIVYTLWPVFIKENILMFLPVVLQWSKSKRFFLGGIYSISMFYIFLLYACITFLTYIILKYVFLKLRMLLVNFSLVPNKHLFFSVTTTGQYPGSISSFPFPVASFLWLLHSLFIKGNFLINPNEWVTLESCQPWCNSFGINWSLIYSNSAFLVSEKWSWCIQMLNKISFMATLIFFFKIFFKFFNYCWHSIFILGSGV